MTIRPVFERPRVLRTLLCLLIGVLALLWRAVPSFSWAPALCPSGSHSHCMCAGDVARWAGSTLGSGRMPSDTYFMYYLKYDDYWCPMCDGCCYYFCTRMRYYTYTLDQDHSVCHTPRFDARIDGGGLHCNTSKAGSYPHYYRQMYLAFEVQGCQLNMTGD